MFSFSRFIISSPAPRAGRRGGSSEARVTARARAAWGGTRAHGPGRAMRPRTRRPQTQRGGPAGRDLRLGIGLGRGRRSGRSKMAAAAAAGRAHAVK